MAIVHILEQHWPGIMSVQERAYSEVISEPLDVLRCKHSITPQTCFVSESEQGSVEAYVLAHRWRDTNPPPLSEIIADIGAHSSADALYLHDLAVAPTVQGKGLGVRLLNAVLASARAMKLKKISLVAVQGAESFWQQQGFVANPAVVVSDSYGEEAVFMEMSLRETNNAGAATDSSVIPAIFIWQ